VTAAPPGQSSARTLKPARSLPNWTITPDLMDAVKRTADIRARGQKLSEWLAQGDAFDQLPGEVQSWMTMFYDPNGNRVASSKAVAESLKTYAQEATRYRPKLASGSKCRR
jgi:hypothetical protein